MARTKLSCDDLRMRLAIRLAVAPRFLFNTLWAPKTLAPARDDARQKLVEFITEGWDSLDIEATTTHEERGHSVPPAAPADPYGGRPPPDDPEDDEMCNLYRMRRGPGEIARLFQAELPAAFEWKADIYPRYDAPVILSVEGARRMGPMRWGFPVEVQGKTKMRTEYVTNARNLDSPVWRPAMARQRCLVPFTSFAEPKPGRDAEGRPAQYWFEIPGAEVSAFAGLWRQSAFGPVFAFCTTDANPLVAPLHPKAMPAILHPEDYETWLTGDPVAARALVAPFPSQLMTVS